MFYAVQTFGQLLRGGADAASKTRSWSVPCVRIEDRPRFSWRGMNLDVARHFFDKQFVKRYIDYLAAYKMNVFHLYLTDDQGWRIEIKRYPRLTEVGAWRKGTKAHYAHGGGDDKRYGGFFTQDDLREIVAYANERFITVLPGISMPGHSQAALAAYPELSSTGGPFEVWTDWGISKEVMDPGKEEVFRFVEGVLTEVIEIFPSRYIHTGGDEVPRDRWKASPYAQARMRQEGLKNEDELQSYFTKRVERFLNSKGRLLIGWDEILEGGLAPNAVVMSWRGTKGGIAAARSAHPVVMVPHEETYFNYMQHKAKHGPGHAGYLPLSAVYRFDPLRGMSEAERKHVLGGHACLWSEFVLTPADVEYLLFPRLLAMAEVLWSPVEGRSEQDFLARLPAQLAALKRAGIRFCPSE
jgi:hexosaminidase